MTGRVRFALGVVSVALIALSALAACAPLPPPAPAPTPTKTVPPVTRTLQAIQMKLGRDAVYCSPGGKDLTLDVFYPLKATGLKPVVLFIHGGGWTYGSKSMVINTAYLLELVSRGYLVASINYRLAPTYPFPAALEDARCAVRFLREKATGYQIDPSRMGVYGDSAGGQIASLLALTGSASTSGEQEWPGQDERIQAAAVFFAPLDLPRLNAAGHERLWSEVFGAAGPDDPRLQLASPMAQVRTGAPPFLIFQGENDPVVPVEGTQDFARVLEAAGVESRVVLVQGAGYAWETQPAADSSPSQEELARLLADFFDRHLRR